jgi:hypothetical protein
MMALLLTVLVGRGIIEGLMYNISYSSMVGDAGLLIIVLIAATVLKRNYAPGRLGIPRLFCDEITQTLVLIVCVSFGLAVCILTLDSRSGQAMDRFHDTVIAPLFVFLAITLLPVIYKNGTWMEKTATVFFILLWGGLVYVDFTLGLLDQRGYLFFHYGMMLK